MPLSLIKTSIPTFPVSVDDLVLFARIPTRDEDENLQRFIGAAVNYVESQLRRTLISSTWRWKLDSFYDGCDRSGILRPPMPPLASVTSIEYIDISGNMQTLTVSTDYVWTTDEEPGMVFPAYNKSWPTTRDFPRSVTITYVAGTTVLGLDPIYKEMVLLAATHFYEHRNPVVSGPLEAPSAVPLTLDQLFIDHRLVLS